MKFPISRNAIAVHNQLIDARSIEGATRILQKVVENNGFSAFAYLATDGRAENNVPINVNSLKPEFVNDYVAGEFWNRDPAVVLASRTKTPYLWRDSYAACDAGMLQVNEWRSVDDLARSHGYRDGFVVPIRTKVGGFSFTLFGSATIQPKAAQEEVTGLGLLGMAFDQWLRQRSTPPPTSGRSRPVRITRREHDVLGWLAEGKTSEDIGMILGVTAKTVDFHVANVMEKLGAVNRVQAVARAIRLGII